MNYQQVKLVGTPEWTAKKKTAINLSQKLDFI